MASISKELLEKYKLKCKEIKLDPNEIILEYLNGLSPSNRILNLSKNNMCVKTYKSLGKFLSDDSHFTELRLSDCLLQEEALKFLLEGIVSNNSISILDLKGNNIRYEGSASLGVYLKCNHHLKSLILDWNNIGALPEAISVFCEGLASNNTLQELILRNNQLSHDGAAEIGSALRKNSSLKILDLKWNSIGLLGGRALAECLQTNRSLILLDLNGNNVPLDCLSSISRSLKYNMEHQNALVELKRREEMLRFGLRRAEENANGQVNDLLLKLDEQQQKSEQINRISSTQIHNLQAVLDERLAAVKTLESKFDVTQNSLTFNLQRNKELENELGNARLEISDLREQHLNILHHEREERAAREQTILTEIRGLREHKQKMELQVNNLEEQLQSCKQQVLEKRDEANNIGELLKQKEIYFKSEIVQIQKHHRDITQEIERKQREIEQQLHAVQLTLVESKEKIKSLESQKSAHEDEIGQLKSKRKIEKEEHEERLKMAQLAKEEMQRTISTQINSIRDSQNKLENCQSEIENQRKLSNKLQNLLAEKEENERGINALKEEVKRSNENARTAKENFERIKIEMKQMENENHDLVNRHNVTLKEKDLEIGALKEQLRLREEHWKQLNEKDVQRAHLLHSAIGAYLQGNPHKSI